MSTQYTPGPWHLGIGNGENSIFPDSGRVRLENGGTTLYPIAQVNKGWHIIEDEANARLISAAPDLLAALQECVDYLDCIPEAAAGGCDDARKLVRIARAAITKAMGAA